MTREDLKINDWLELIKEDKNLNGAYISIAQYIYLIEKENKELEEYKNPINYFKYANKNVTEQNKQLKGTTHCFDEEEHEKLKKQVEEYKDKINWYENFEVNKTIDKLRLKHNTQQKEFINYL